MKPIYTLRNDEWRITVKIGREPMNASKPIAAHYYCDDASTENGLRFSERKLYRNFDEALSAAVVILGMTHKTVAA